jgi:uncharacterized phage protein (TIGR02216 family)
MAFGLGVLRLSPRDFWSMTPRELHHAAEAIYGRQTGAPGRSELDSLMRLFPD